MSEPGQAWPLLPLADWEDTCETLHMWTQIVGKVKLALCPFLNQWWGVALSVSARGLASGPIPYAAGIFEMDFDFVDQHLVIRTSAGATRTVGLYPRTVADFYHELMASLRALGIDVAITPLPCEVPHPIAFDQHDIHASYDAVAVQRWWRIMVQVSKVMERFRSGFVGKASPVLFFWGSFDLAGSRFSGRPAPLPDGPRFYQLAENQENFTYGFWPGNTTMAGFTLGAPACYAYAYPAPPGFASAPIRPAPARFHAQLGEFILPWEAVHSAEKPDEAIFDFFQSTYEAAAVLGHWDRTALERQGEPS